MKVCNKCKETKPASTEWFYTDKKGKNGLAQTCKECTKERARNWTKENKERKKASDAEYAKKNADSVREYQQKYRERNKEKNREYSIKYRLENSEKLRKQAKEYNADPLVKARRNQLNTNRRKHDIKYRLTSNVRSAISEALKGRRGALRHVSWSISDLRKHLERQFTENMNWANYGKWHVDHIMPASSFKYESQNDVEFKRCWCLSNLRPLWAEDNCSKQAKITHLL